MLLRIIAENILSFKEATELNTFSGTIKSKSHHKQTVKKIDFLKVTSIYGANGAGKSNIINVLEFLQDSVAQGSLDFQPDAFRLDKVFYNEMNSKIDIEFLFKGIFFYYEISFKDEVIIKEILWKDSNENRPSKIFERTTNPKKKTIKLEVNGDYIKSDKDKLRISILEEEVVGPYQLAFSNKILRKSIKEIDIAYTWLTSHLVIITPDSQFKNLVARALSEEQFFKYLNETIPALDTGINKIEIKDSSLESFFGEDEKDEIEKVRKVLDKNDSAVKVIIPTNFGDVVAVKENGKYLVKHIQLFHKCKEVGEGVHEPFEIADESDGTQRLFDLIPMAYSLLIHEKTYIVDEIERSIHPALIIELLSKILDKRIKGQLIFTTHESSLLDLEVFRQDEIWFAEKNPEGATKLYPLSDFKPRFDLDIRKGYLTGRFGAIPFLGNLKDLKWNMINEEK